MKFGGVFLIDDKFIFTEFHFTNIYDTVAAIDEQIDLSTRLFRRLSSMAPCGRFGLHSGNSKGFLNLRHVLEADILKGIATPRIPGWRSPDSRPVTVPFPAIPAQMKQCEFIN